MMSFLARFLSFFLTRANESESTLTHNIFARQQLSGSLFANLRKHLYIIYNYYILMLLIIIFVSLIPQTWSKSLKLAA